MQLIPRSLRLTVTFSLLSCAFAAPIFARQTTVIGTAGVGYDFRERSYDQTEADFDGNEGDAQKTKIGPALSVVSKGMYDTFSLNYAPQFSYDSVDDTNEVDQRLNLRGERYLSRDWSFAVADNFLSSDDPGVSSSSYADPSTSGENEPPLTTSDENEQLPTTSGNELSRDRSGRQYWTNTATMRTAYAFAQSSRIGGGYSYSVLRNDQGSDGYDDYDKHTVFSDFLYGFNQNWRSSLGLNYTRGLYDREDTTSGTGSANGTPDLDEYDATFGIDYVRSLRDFFPLKYSFSDTQYDGDTRRDSEAHQWSAGWDHAFDTRTRLSMGGGPSFVKIQGLEGSWGYNAYLSFAKKYEHASYALLLDKQYDTRNFTGNTNDSGLTDTYNARAKFSYQYTESLALNVFGRYSLQSNLDPQGDTLTAVDTGGFSAEQSTGDITYDKDIYEAGAGVSYSFAQWYTAGIRYVYYVSDGNLASDQYTDHQVLFTLAATKELWRW